MEIFGELGMTSLQPTDGDGTKFSGLGLGGGANYRIKAGSNLMIGLGGQLHYFSGSGDSDGVKVTTTAMTIQPGLSLMFAATPDVSLGGFFATDLFMLTGKYSTQSEDGSLSFNLKSFSQTIFGFRGIFAAGNGLGVGGQIAMGNGNIGIDFGGLGSLTAAFKSQTFALFVTKSL